MKEDYLKVLFQEKSQWETKARNLNTEFVGFKKANDYHMSNIERINNEIKELIGLEQIKVNTLKEKI